MEFSLRPPTPADFAAVASWITDAEACRRWAGPQVPFPFSARELPTLINATEANTFCLCSDACALLGFAQFFDKGNGVVRLARVIVSPSCRGHGLATELCRLLMDKAMNSFAVETFSLGVYRDNPAAIAVYAKLGFSLVEEQSAGESMTMILPAFPAPG